MNYFYKLRDIKRTFISSNKQMATVRSDEEYCKRMDQFAKAERSIKEADHVFKLLNLGREDSILDYGCNTGRFLDRARKEYRVNAYGVDINDAAIEKARDQFPEVHFSLITNKSLKFPDHFFDAITMNHVIGHLEDPYQVLIELHRVLKPGGKLLIVTPNKWYKATLSFMNIFNSYKPDPTVLQYFTQKSLAQAIGKAGFHIEENQLFGEYPKLGSATISLPKCRFRIILIAIK